MVCEVRDVIPMVDVHVRHYIYGIILLYIDNVTGLEDPSSLISPADEKTLDQAVSNSTTEFDVGAPSSAHSQGIRLLINFR